MGRWHICLENGLVIVNRHQTKIRFILTGALNTIVGMTVYPALYFCVTPLKQHYLMILSISQVLCVTFSFLTTKFMVFRTTANYLQEFGKFVTFHASYFLVNLAALPALVEFLGINPVWAQMLFTVLVIVSSYFWHSRITFSASQAPNYD